MANLPSLSNCDHRLYISSRAHHCGCSCNCSCRSQTSLWSHLQAGSLSCLILQVRELHRSCSRKFAKCIALAFVQVCDLHLNRTCDARRFFAVALLPDHGRACGVYCSGSIIWCSRWKLVVALNGRDWGDSHGLVRCHVSADATIHQNYEINYSNVHFNNCIICLVISSLFLYVKLKIN